MPDVLRKPVRGALFAYAIIYTVQVVFDTFYSDVLAPSDVYRVLNYLTAVGILVSVVVVWSHKTSGGSADASAGRYLAAQAGFYCTLALAILFFSLWFRLLNMADGESFSEADTERPALCGAAIANAVADALGCPEKVTRLPLNPERVRRIAANIA